MFFSTKINEWMKKNSSLFMGLVPVIFFLFLSSNTANSQQIDLVESSGTVKEKNIRGFTICLELDVKSVETGLGRFVKSIGKFDKAERNAWAGLTQVIPAISSDAIDFFARMTVSPRCIQVFMGANRSGTETPLAEGEKENLRKMLYDFAVEQYRSDLKKQISEAERVVSLAVRAHDKRSEEGEELKQRLNRNRKEKIRLQEDLELNGRNNQRLLSDSIRNSTEKETAFEEIKKVRQIAEEKKLKLSQVK
jgi:hypothetical protein